MTQVTQCKARLEPMVQGSRHFNPVLTIVDGDGDAIDTQAADSWAGRIRLRHGAWRDIAGTLTALSDGRVEWQVDDGDDEADTPLLNPVPAEIQLRGDYGGSPLYTVTGEFLLCRGGWAPG